MSDRGKFPRLTDFTDNQRGIFVRLSLLHFIGRSNSTFGFAVLACCKFVHACKKLRSNADVLHYQAASSPEERYSRLQHPSL